MLRWALLFSTIVAVVLPLYWLLEPGRQTAEAEGFEERAVERGAVLYANDEMEAYDDAKSLLCANCHGTDGGGGSANYTITPDAQGDAEARPVQVAWQAPALNTVLYRFNECTADDVAAQTRNCTRPEEQVTDIITYGRPGTPMPAWGIDGGGPKNEQAVSDLVEYLKSIQLTPAQAQAAGDRGRQARCRTRRRTRSRRREATSADARGEPRRRRRPRRRASRTTIEVDGGDRSRSSARGRSRQQIANASQGELLFDVNCARCHTKGWSYNDPAKPRVPAARARRAAARSARRCAAARCSSSSPACRPTTPSTPGFQSQYDWVADGVEAHKGYGVRGISSGRMPHFGQILTKAQINAIIRYERNL